MSDYVYVCMLSGWYVVCSKSYMLLLNDYSPITFTKIHNKKVATAMENKEHGKQYVWVVPDPLLVMGIGFSRDIEEDIRAIIQGIILLS
jgi:hypothetical protein